MIELWVGKVKTGLTISEFTVIIPNNNIVLIKQIQTINDFDPVVHALPGCKL